MSNAESDQEFVKRKLEELRKRLLDLSARNRLLNYRHTKTSSLRIIDELPDALYGALAGDEVMKFRAVPHPTEKELIDAGYLQYDENHELVRLRPDPDAPEWAKHLGLSTTYELPKDDSGEEKHHDNDIQTLLYAEQLEAVLRSLYNKANLAIAETGANVLYLALGFLEWYESTHSDESRIAPLFLMPVTLRKGKLDRKTNLYFYTLEYSGEDIVLNISLEQKLKADFGLKLPELDDGVSPEDYFNVVEEVISGAKKDDWKVRRLCTLTLLNFNKLLMYLDLDPDRWPTDDRNLTKHEVVTQFFGGGEERPGAGSFLEEYEIDEQEEVNEKYPLIDDADSSQHSALFDAIDGKNLVIEGPPGTGKSQTITNLIAAALGQGKKVLFVSEKMAALEVVKRRLDRANLGDFCLELHSHKTQKKKVLDDIRHRLSGRYPRPRNWDEEIEQHEHVKTRLKDHARIMNEEYGETRRTVHEILTMATRYREELGIDPVTVHPEGLESHKLTSAHLRQLTDNIRMYKDVYTQVLKELGAGRELNSHPWFGVCNEDLQHFDAGDVSHALQVWQESLLTVSAGLSDLRSLVGSGGLEASDVQTLKTILKPLVKLATLKGSEDLSAIASATASDLNQLGSYLREYVDLRDLTKHVLQTFTEADPTATNPSQPLTTDIDNLLNMGVRKEMTISALKSLVANLTEELQRFEEIEPGLQEMLEGSDSRASQFFTQSMAGYQELIKFSQLVVQLDARLVGLRNELFDNETLDTVLPDLHVRLDSLKPLRDDVRYVFDLNADVDLAQLLAIKEVLEEKKGLFCWFSRAWQNAKKELLGYRCTQKVPYRKVSSEIYKFIRFKEEVGELEASADYERLLGHHFKGIDTDVADLMALREWYRQVRKEYGVGFGNRVAVGNALIASSPGFMQGVRSLDTQGVFNRLESYLKSIETLSRNLSNVANLINGGAPIGGKENLLPKLSTDLASIIGTIANAIRDETLTMSQIADGSDDLAELRCRKNEWQQNAILTRIFGDRVRLPLDLHANVKGDFTVASETHSLYRKIAALPDESLSARIKSYTTIEEYEHLRGKIVRLLEYLGTEETAYSAFKEIAGVTRSLWTSVCGEDLSALIARNADAMQNPEWMSHWVSFYRFRSILRESGFSRLADQLESEKISLEKAHDACMLGVFDVLAREILKTHPHLSRFASSQHQALRNEFSRSDHDLKEVQQKRIASVCGKHKPPGGMSGGRVSEYTDLALIQRECEKKTRHIPIRQLVARSQEALMALKPCFMMGPMSVAQYLQPGTVEFDLVVMDEASQIKPEDALGAIARGRQVVIVGDPKQLPPTSFFDKLIDDDTEEEDRVVLEDSESVLEAVAPMFERRRLRWHYRSRHESLIYFSNSHFYDDDLVVFPSPHTESEEFGIKFHYVKRGKFINRRNAEEARTVAEAVAKHLKRKGHESLGVVAMSAEQRNQIERNFEDLVKGDPLLQATVEDDRDTIEPLFFKNLENVQGDERDVMYISCTYGPQEVGGSVPQRFGPINQDNGWRRLNVLFTRSKKRMHVFSSMLHGQLRTDANSRQGVIALKEFLEYAQHGRIRGGSVTGRAADNDFEIAVGRALHNRGFECDYQVGVAGYFIDLAVRDPGNPGRFLMGIECDGATYHSAKSVRDRDRLRQEVLEGLGWKIMRIWSTDWFVNPEAQLNPILDELAKLRTEPVEPPETYQEVLDEEERELLEFIDQDNTLPLRDLLIKFDKEVIGVDQPDVNPARRLLSNAMVEALDHSRPITRQEFFEGIPEYLRSKVDPKQGKFLDQVLEIIENYESETSP